MAVIVIALVAVAVAVSWGVVGGTEFRNAPPSRAPASAAAAAPHLEIEPVPGSGCDALTVYDAVPGQRGYPTIDEAVTRLVERTDAVSTRHIGADKASVFVRSESRLRILDLRRAAGGWLSHGERSGPVGCAPLESAFRR